MAKKNRANKAGSGDKAGKVDDVRPPEPVLDSGAGQHDPAPVQMPVFSELEAERAPDTEEGDEPGDSDGAGEPADSVPGNREDCPSCGVMPRTCPTGHEYYEGMTEEECGELVDVWVTTCQGIASAARGAEPRDVDPKLRARFAKVLARQSRRYRPLSAGIEIPLLLAATASTCTVEKVAATDQAANGAGGEPQSVAAPPATPRRGVSW